MKWMLMVLSIVSVGCSHHNFSNPTIVTKRDIASNTEISKISFEASGEASEILISKATKGMSSQIWVAKKTAACAAEIGYYTFAKYDQTKVEFHMSLELTGICAPFVLPEGKDLVPLEVVDAVGMKVLLATESGGKVGQRGMLRAGNVDLFVLEYEEFPKLKLKHVITAEQISKTSLKPNPCEQGLTDAWLAPSGKLLLAYSGRINLLTINGEEVSQENLTGVFKAPTNGRMACASVLHSFGKNLLLRAPILIGFDESIIVVDKENPSNSKKIKLK